MDPITNNLISKVEPALRGLGDKSINTNVQINKLTDTLKTRFKQDIFMKISDICCLVQSF